MARKTKINLLEGIAGIAAAGDITILLNALNQENPNILDNFYVQALALVARAGAISTIYRESRTKNKYA